MKMQQSPKNLSVLENHVKRTKWGNKMQTAAVVRKYFFASLEGIANLPTS